VNAYTDETALETTLLEGRVRVQGAILQPGQQARVRAGGTVKVVKDVNEDQVVAWKNGAFKFEDKTLPEVMRQLARWYDVQVAYEGKIPEIVFSGEMGRGLSLSQCLTILEKMNVHFRVEGKTLVVMP
jgi:transmembrane sensor